MKIAKTPFNRDGQAISPGFPGRLPPNPLTFRRFMASAALDKRPRSQIERKVLIIFNFHD